MSDEFVDPFAGAPADEAQAAPPAPPEDAFAAPPAEAAPAPAPAPAPEPAKKAPAKKAPAKAAPAAPAAPVVVGGDGKVVLTFKGGTGFDAPWIVIHATSLDDALEQISGPNAATLMQIMERTQVAGQAYSKLGGGSGGSAGGAPRQPRQAAPAPAQQPPAGSPPCPGEGWVYKTGVSKSGPKAGQTWQAWMPPDHLKNAGTKPVWF